MRIQRRIQRRVEGVLIFALVTALSLPATSGLAARSAGGLVQPMVASVSVKPDSGPGGTTVDIRGTGLQYFIHCPLRDPLLQRFVLQTNVLGKASRECPRQIPREQGGAS